MLKLKPLHPMPYGYNRTDLTKCIEREIRMRHLVYPKRVLDKKVTKREAERELGMMEQILDAVKTATMCDNADLCVAAMFIELKKYSQLDSFFALFNHSEMEIIQKNITNHIRENIYEVKQIDGELGLNRADSEDVGL